MRLAALKVGLLYYMVGQEHLYAVLLEQGGQHLQFRLVPYRQLFSRLDQLCALIEGGYPLTSRSAAVFHDFAYRWGRELLPPYEYLQPFDILVIIPHHTLHGLPLHMIWLEEEHTFLATAHAITYCSSATLFTRCVDRNPLRQLDLSTWEFFTQGDGLPTAPAPPEFGVSVGRDVKGDQSAHYERLAQTFASHFDPQRFRFLGPQVKADRNVIKHPRSEEGWAATWEVICIVCHGHYDAAFPDNSGLLLEGERWGLAMQRGIYLFPDILSIFPDHPFRNLPPGLIPRPDCVAELLTVSELKVNCYTGAQLVALFGCSTGASQVISGDDGASVAHQWLKLGAVSVLANFWKSDIAFIEQWSTYFLTNWLQKRQPKAIAWQQATRSVLEEQPDLDPFIWGPISLLGDWL